MEMELDIIPEPETEPAPESRAPKLTITDGCKIRIAAFESETLGKVGQKTIDLTPYTGLYVRIWLNSDKSYSLNPNEDHLWQIAEFQVPETVPLDLTSVEFDLWELPE